MIFPSGRNKELAPTRHRHAQILQMLAEPFLPAKVKFVEGDICETHPGRWGGETTVEHGDIG